MKRLWVLLMLAGLCSVTQAQDRIYFMDDSVYSAARSPDTSAWKSIGAHDRLTLVFTAEDSVNVSVKVQYRVDNTATNFQTYTAIDSTASLTTTGYFNGKLLRAAATDNIPGASRVRVIVTRVNNGKNGVTTPTYDVFMWRD
jgi:hypothetical protein